MCVERNRGSGSVVIRGPLCFLEPVEDGTFASFLEREGDSDLHTDADRGDLLGEGAVEDALLADTHGSVVVGDHVGESV